MYFCACLCVCFYFYFTYFCILVCVDYVFSVCSCMRKTFRLISSKFYVVPVLTRKLHVARRGKIDLKEHPGLSTHYALVRSRIKIDGRYVCPSLMA